MIGLYQSSAHAFTYSLAIGPTSVGVGGSNPPSGSVQEFQGSIIFDSSELVFSITPGIFYAWRSAKLGPYVSFGPGVVINANGAALGATAAFGYNMFCMNQCLMLEFRKAIGFISGNILAPYTAKIGFTHIL